MKKKAKNYFYKIILKPLLDLVLALTAIVLLSPLLIIIALAIKMDSKGPVFFTQKRLGLEEKKFLLFKFRTMTHKDRKVLTQVYPGDPEVTKVGSFLRHTKLDELPQLFNILLGNMAVIGPRPCVPSIQNKFDKNTPYRFKVKPGLSSLAAIKGSVYLTWAEKWEYDREYVEKLSLKLDIIIILNTLRIMLLGEKKLFTDGNKRL